VVEQSKPKKIKRAKLLVVSTINVDAQRDAGQSNQEEVQIPVTPMQRIGMELRIDPAKLTREQLEADPRNRPNDSQDD